MNIKTDEEVKKDCVEMLKELIIDIESDDTSDNYTYSWDLIKAVSDGHLITRDVRFSVSRTEYIKTYNNG